jgi:hypothetical protein
MIVWGGGGKFNSGGRYNPSTDVWVAASTANAPSGRVYHQSVWTGSEMLIWGGEGFGVLNVLNTGGRYNPGTDSWTSTSPTDAPVARRDHTAVWTGGEMIVWGGLDGSSKVLNTGGRYCAQPSIPIDAVTPAAGRTSGGQQIILTGVFNGLSSVMMGSVQATWVYTNGNDDTSSITVTTPAQAVGAVQIHLTTTSGIGFTKANAFACLPTVFTDNAILAGQTTARAQHIIEVRQAVDAMRAVAGLSPAPWTDATLVPTSSVIKAIHIQELRIYLDDAATRLGYSTSPYTDPSLTIGDVIKRIHIEELRQRIRIIAG